MELESLVRDCVSGLLRELVDGPSAEAAYVLNPGDTGLLGSLARLSAAEARARPGGRSSIAAHVEHVRYGLELLNRWSRGEDPFGDADYAASWERQRVTDDEWQDLRSALDRELRAWISSFNAPRQWEQVTLSGAIGSMAHLAYHLGAIRQLASSAAGPPAQD